jgi:hypothetical protein
MRQWLRSHLTYANVMVTILAFLVLGGGTALGAYVVSNNSQIGPNTVAGHKPFPGQHANIIPGTLNDKDLANSAVTNPKIGANAVTGPKVLDNGLTGADVASLSGADVTDNSLTGADVNEASLGQVPDAANADKLDGLDSTSFVSTSSLRQVGPITLTPPDGGSQGAVLAGTGHFVFSAGCINNGPPGDDVRTTINTDVAHSSYATTTEAPTGSHAAPDFAGDGGFVMGSGSFTTGDPVFHTASGAAVAPDGQQVIFDLYEGMNARNQPGECIFGGTLAVK